MSITRGAIRLAAGLGMVLAGLGPARSQGAGSVYGFGDSLVDNGNIPKYIGFFPYPPSYYMAHFSNGPVFLEYLPGLLGQGFQRSNDFGVGGAFADAGNLAGSILPGTSTEIATAAQQGIRFAPRDTVALWAGSNNDFALLERGLTAGQVPQQAQAIVGAIAADAKSLVGLGARRLVVLNIPDLGLTPAYRGSDQQGVATGIAAAENAELAPALRAATAGSGANVTLIDTFGLLRLTVANPAAFGLANVTASCVATPSCVDASRSVQDQNLFWDDVHPTTGIHERIAEVIANVLAAPDTVAVQAQLAIVDGTNFSRAMAERVTAASRDVTQGKVSFGIGSGIGTGSFDGRGNADGFSYDDGSVTGWAETLVAPGVLVGLAGGAGRPSAHLDDGAGTLNEDAYHAGLYGALFRSGPAADWHVGVSAGWSGIRAARAARTTPLIGFDIDGSPDGDVAASSLDAAYGRRFGVVEIGPAGGLDFAEASLGGYDETGVSVLTQSVGGQDVASLAGHVGLRASAAFGQGAFVVTPVGTVEAAREFLDTSRTLETGFSGLPIETRLPGYGATYGLARAGVAAVYRDRLALDADFTTTFLRPGVTERVFAARASVGF